MRTIFELSRLYGFHKFIIVVPGVAIGEGGLKSIEITRKHFRALCNNVEFDHFIMPSKKVSKLRHFAVSNTLQILVINIDAFRKNSTSTDAENTSTWSGKPRAKTLEKLRNSEARKVRSGRRPFEALDVPFAVVINAAEV